MVDNLSTFRPTKPESDVDSNVHYIWEMKVQIMERKTWDKVLRATEMENSMTYVLKCWVNIVPTMKPPTTK
jgi:hypothetical protein